MKFQNILSLAQKHLYFTATFTKTSNNVLSYWYGPAGSLFLENIKSEWMHSNVVNRDASVLLFMGEGETVSDKELYLKVRGLYDKQLPFGIAKIYDESIEEEVCSALTETTYFNPLKRACFSTEMFVAPSDGNHYFLHWQRQRKLWWKKISYSPNRFSLSEIYKENDGHMAVNILVKFPWGNEVLEKISILQLKSTPELDISARFGRKNVLPVQIRNTMNIQTAILGLFCDAYDEIGSNSTVLRIHRKLTPYKCILCVAASESTQRDQVYAFASTLVKQMKKSGISTMLPPRLDKSPLVSQILINDECGIPYTIILDSATLTTGVLRIRNRDTTLNEEVHVSEANNYMKQLIGSF